MILLELPYNNDIQYFSQLVYSIASRQFIYDFISEGSCFVYENTGLPFNVYFKYTAKTAMMVPIFEAVIAKLFKVYITQLWVFICIA